LSSSQNPSAKRPTSGFKLTLAILALSCAAALGYLAALRQTNTSTAAPQKTYALNLGGLHLQLGAGLLGLAVIFTLAVLFGVAVFLAIVARRRQRLAVAANVELEKEMVERRHAQQELHAQKTLLETTVDSIGEGIIVSNEQGGFLLFNPAAQRILNRGPQDATPETWSDFTTFFGPIA
jgi:PAS domain-containing protein